MSRDYQTHPRNFVGKGWQQEQLYTPDKKVVEALHRLLDMVKDDNIALSIDHCVALIMQLDGYGQPRRYREMHDPEMIEPNA